jgi:isochorismate hydrolase
MVYYNNKYLLLKRKLFGGAMCNKLKKSLTTKNIPIEYTAQYESVSENHALAMLKNFILLK